MQRDQDLVQDRRQKWTAKLEAAASGSAGGLHKLSKATEIWIPRRAATAHAAADPVAGCADCAGRLEPCLESGRPHPAACATVGAGGAREAARLHGGRGGQVEAYRGDLQEKTGVGVDRWHPSMLQGASDTAYHTFLDTLREAERTLVWPVQMATIIFFLIPKSFTTDRAIGILPATIRVWEILREPRLQKWAKDNQHSWDCTSHG